MQNEVADHAAANAVVRLGGGAQAVARHRARGKRWVRACAWVLGCKSIERVTRTHARGLLRGAGRGMMGDPAPTLIHRLPRERIDALLDVGSPFLELSPLAGHGLYGAVCCARCVHSCRVAVPPLSLLASDGPFLCHAHRC